MLSASIAAGEAGPLITLSGSVDITNLAELSEVLADPRVNGTAHLTIDASGLSSADSMAARAPGAMTLRARPRSGSGSPRRSAIWPPPRPPQSGRLAAGGTTPAIRCGNAGLRSALYP